MINRDEDEFDEIGKNNAIFIWADKKAGEFIGCVKAELKTRDNLSFIAKAIANEIFETNDEENSFCEMWSITFADAVCYLYTEGKMNNLKSRVHEYWEEEHERERMAQYD